MARAQGNVYVDAAYTSQEAIDALGGVSPITGEPDREPNTGLEKQTKHRGKPQKATRLRRTGNGWKRRTAPEPRLPALPCVLPLSTPSSPAGRSAGDGTPSANALRMTPLFSPRSSRVQA